jgi:hypothetical protein
MPSLFADGVCSSEPAMNLPASQRSPLAHGPRGAGPVHLPRLGNAQAPNTSLTQNSPLPRLARTKPDKVRGAAH